MFNDVQVMYNWCLTWQLIDLIVLKFQVSTVSRLGGCHGSIYVNLPQRSSFWKWASFEAYMASSRAASAPTESWVANVAIIGKWFSPQRGLPVPPLVLYHHQIQPHQSTHAIPKGNRSQEKHKLSKISKVASACTCGRRHWSRRNPHWSLLLGLRHVQTRIEFCCVISHTVLKHS